MTADLFKWRRYQAEIILTCVRWYLCHSLSYRDPEETMTIVGIVFVVMFLIGVIVPATGGVFLGTLSSAAVGVVLINLWNRRTNRPTSIMMAPLAMLLVSGSIGFRGLAALTVGQTALGVEQYLQMFVVALAIGVGLLVDNSIVRQGVTL